MPIGTGTHPAKTVHNADSLVIKGNANNLQKDRNSYCKSFSLILNCLHPEQRLPFQSGANMYICLCKAVTHQQVTQAVEQGQSYADIRKSLGVATDCGCCGQVAKKAIQDHLARMPVCEFAEAS